MKCKKIFLFIVIFASHESYSQVSKQFTDLQLLLGTWGMQTKKGMLYERWQKLNDSTLVSQSYKVNGADTVFLERVQLVRRGRSMQYVATVSDENGGKSVTFSLVKLENNTYVFENAQHDFPQRVIYSLPEKESLHAWIEGTVNGQLKKSDFFYNKVK